MRWGFLIFWALRKRGWMDLDVIIKGRAGGGGGGIIWQLVWKSKAHNYRPSRIAVGRASDRKFRHTPVGKEMFFPVSSFSAGSLYSVGIALLYNCMPQHVCTVKILSTGSYTVLVMMGSVWSCGSCILTLVRPLEISTKDEWNIKNKPKDWKTTVVKRVESHPL